MLCGRDTGGIVCRLQHFRFAAVAGSGGCRAVRRDLPPGLGSSYTVSY
jgi:hypothetical protein